MTSQKWAEIAEIRSGSPKAQASKTWSPSKAPATSATRSTKKIIAPLVKANKLADMPDFNDSTKLDDGKDKVDRLTNLIAICRHITPSLSAGKHLQKQSPRLL